MPPLSQGRGEYPPHFSKVCEYSEEKWHTVWNIKSLAVDLWLVIGGKIGIKGGDSLTFIQPYGGFENSFHNYRGTFILSLSAKNIITHVTIRKNNFWAHLNDHK